MMKVGVQSATIEPSLSTFMPHFFFLRKLYVLYKTNMLIGTKTVMICRERLILVGMIVELCVVGFRSMDRLRYGLADG